MSEDNLIESNSGLNTLLHVTSYPESKRVYCYETGRLLENCIRDLSEDFINDIAELHFTLKDKDADIIFNNSSLALEILNHYRPRTDNVRVRRILENLKGYRFKGVVTSRISNAMRNLLKGVPILELGFQLLPRKYLSYYASIRQTYGRKFEGKRTIKILRNMIKSFLIRIGVLKIPRIVNKSKFSYVYSMDISEDYRNTVEDYNEDITKDCGMDYGRDYGRDVPRAFRGRLRSRYRSRYRVSPRVFYDQSSSGERREYPLDIYTLPDKCPDCTNLKACLLVLSSLDMKLNNPKLVSLELGIPYETVKALLHCAYDQGLVSRRFDYTNGLDIKELDKHQYYYGSFRIPIWRYHITPKTILLAEYYIEKYKNIQNEDREKLKTKNSIDTIGGIPMEYKLVTENTLKAFKQVKATLIKRLKNCYLQSMKDALMRRIENVGKCQICGIPFKVGDSVVKYGKHGTNWAHLECYERITIDIPDSILDPQDIQFIGGERYAQNN